MNIVKGVAGLIWRTSSGRSGEYGSVPESGRFSPPNPTISFSGVGDEAILKELWGRYVNSVDEVEKRKLLHTFLKQFLTIFQNWKPFNVGQSLEEALTTPHVEYAENIGDVVVGCNLGHPAEIILLLTEEISQITRFLTDSSGSVEHSGGEEEVETGARNIDEVFEDDSLVTSDELAEILGDSVLDLDPGTMVPMAGDRPHRPPPGKITLYAEYFKYGLSLPYLPFLGDVLTEHRLCVSQLNPQFFSHFGAFSTGLARIGVEYDIDAFRSLFTIKRSTSWPYVFLLSRGKKLVEVQTDAKVTWRKKFFFFPLDRLGFVTPTEWRLSFGTTPMPKDAKDRREEFRKLGLYDIFPAIKKKSVAEVARAGSAAALGSSGSKHRGKEAVPSATKGKDKGKGKAVVAKRGASMSKKSIDFAAVMARIPPTAGKAAPKVAAPNVRPGVSSSKAGGGALSALAAEKRADSSGLVHASRPSSLGKRPREASPPAQRGYGKGLFTYGINQQLGVKSLWDSAEQGVAHDLMRGLINQHDSLRLSTLPMDELERLVCANSGRNVQLVSEMRAKSERSAARVDEMTKEMTACREALAAAEEKVAKQKEKELALTAKLKGALRDLEEEAKYGRRFLDSSAGQAHDADVRLAAVEAYRSSEEFESQLSVGSETAVFDAIATTVRECRAELRAREGYGGDDFSWLFPQVADLGEDEIGDDEASDDDEAGGD